MDTDLTKDNLCNLFDNYVTEINNRVEVGSKYLKKKYNQTEVQSEFYRLMLAPYILRDLNNNMNREDFKEYLLTQFNKLDIREWSVWEYINRSRINSIVKTCMQEFTRDECIRKAENGIRHNTYVNLRLLCQK